MKYIWKITNGKCQIINTKGIQNKIFIRIIISDKNLSLCLTYKDSSSEYVLIGAFVEVINKVNISNGNEHRIIIMREE